MSGHPEWFAADDEPADDALLLPYQRRWIADQSDLKAAEKSRRTGFSWGEAADDALICSSNKAAGGTNILYIGYNHDMARQFVGDVGKWAKAYGLAAGKLGEFLFDDIDPKTGDSRQIKSFRIDFASGFSTIALPARPRSLRSTQGIVVLDEGAFQEEFRQALEAASALQIWGGKIRVISTHNGADNPYNELLNEIRAGRRAGWSLHRVPFDLAVREGLARRVFRKSGKEWTPAAEKAWYDKTVAESFDPDQELFCIPRESAGAYLPLALLQRQENDQIPVVRWRQKTEWSAEPDHVRRAEAREWCERELAPIIESFEPSWPSWFGMDFGRSGDLSVIWPGQTGQSLKRHTRAVIELRNIPFREQEFILFWLADRMPRLQGGAMDARGNGQALAEFAVQRYGAMIEAVMPTTEFYRTEWPKAKAALEDGLFDIPRDRDVQSDLRSIEVIRGVPMVADRHRGGDGGQRHGDAAIAKLLAHRASEAAPWTAGYDRAEGSARDRYSEGRAGRRPASTAAAAYDDDDDRRLGRRITY